MARKHKTIFDIKQYTKFVLPLFAGMSNPLVFDSAHSSSWYAVVKPNLRNFGVGKPIIRPYTKDKGAQERRDFSFIPTRDLTKKKAKGEHQLEINETALLNYFKACIDEECRKIDEKGQLKEIRRLWRAYNHWKDYEKRAGNDETEYVRKRVKELATEISKKDDYELQKDRVTNFVEAVLPNISRRGKTHDQLYFQQVSALFKAYCQELLTKWNTLPQMTFNQIIREFLLGLAKAGEAILYDKRDWEELPYELKTSKWKLIQYESLARFVMACQLYEACINLQENRVDLSTPIQDTVAQLLKETAEHHRNPFIEVKGNEE